MSVNSRIAALRNEMKSQGIDAYIVPTADFHQTEYVGDYFKSREYITGFQGSAGVGVITTEKSYLWTDGRYFIQAASELEGTEVELCKMGNPGVPTVFEFLSKNMTDGSTLGFDGRTVSLKEGNSYKEMMDAKGGKCATDTDLIDGIWTDRPALSTKPAYHLDEKYTGENVTSKLERIRTEMKEQGASAHLVTTLDDICWIMNFRGDDVDCNPLVLSYAIIKMDSVDLYVDTNKFNETINTDLAANGVSYHPYNAVYAAMGELKDETLLIEPEKVNFSLFNDLDKSVTLLEGVAPSSLMKAMKNEVELENIRIAHIKDGTAVTKFMYWLKQNLGKVEMTEMSNSDVLEKFRAEQGDFIGPSFSPISGYGPHAALCHYRSTPETNSVIEQKGLYLLDSGANFIEGSTDITRTFAVGPLTDEEVHHFTSVCRAMLRLSATKFNYGVGGCNLDALARGIMWNEGLDYNHGTGHGVGYLTSIHEGPANIRWNASPASTTRIEKGMIFSNEPGMYVEGSHGIRTENLMIAQPWKENKFGKFMQFETIAFAPIDLDAIDPEMMTSEEKQQLNDYHSEVFEKIGPHLTEEEREWLKEYTRAI